MKAMQRSCVESLKARESAEAESGAMELSQIIGTLCDQEKIIQNCKGNKENKDFVKERILNLLPNN